MNIGRILLTFAGIGSGAFGQITTNPFPEPIHAKDGIIFVKFLEFATIPEVDGEAPRLMLLLDEPGTKRLFVNAMQGPIYSVSYDGKTVVQYLDVNAADWKVGVQFSSHDRGFQSFAFHPEFAQRGNPGYGRFYTYTDTTNTTPSSPCLNRPIYGFWQNQTTAVYSAKSRVA